jgi:nucleoside-diphosphate-sugar epimerase
VRRRFRPIVWRVLADALIAGLSLAAGFVVCFCAAVFSSHPLPPRVLLRIFVSDLAAEAPLLAAVLAGVFALFGVYTRTRFYVRRFKALALFEAIAVAYGIFLALLYFLQRPWGAVPRSALGVSFAVTLGLAMGLRLMKGYLETRFRVEPRNGAAGRFTRNVLVVGGAGYIGSILVRDLLADGYAVRVLDSLDYGAEPVSGLAAHPSFELIRGDFRHVGPVVQAVKGMDAVIHLGAIVGDPACAVDEDETLETNLAATRLLADVCRASGVSRILFASTCSIYGAAADVVAERSQPHPVSLYAATKIDSEKVLLAARDRHFHPVILRLATAFGWSYRPRFDLVVNLLAAKAAAEKKIQIYNGEQWRPFIHVRDISRAFRAALAAPLPVVSGEIFNTGSNSMNFTLRQLAEKIAALQPGLTVEYVNTCDARNYRVRFDKIQAALGFHCRTSLEAGIQEIVSAVQAGDIGDYREPRYSNVQLVARRHENMGSRVKLRLTALDFAKNSAWWREVAAGSSSDELLRNHSTGLAALGRALQQERQSAAEAQSRGRT